MVSIGQISAPAATITTAPVDNRLGALAVNAFCAALIVRFRSHRGSLTRAAFLSARNDVFANIAIILAAGVTVFYPSAWPDLAVGLAIMAINADAARAIWKAAREERRSEMREARGVWVDRRLVIQSATIHSRCRFSRQIG